MVSSQGGYSDKGAKERVTFFAALTPKFMDFNFRVEFAHRMDILSDDIYKSAVENCRGDYVNTAKANSLCLNSLQRYEECTSGIDLKNILAPVCDKTDLKPSCQVMSFPLLPPCALDFVMMCRTNSTTTVIKRFIGSIWVGLRYPSCNDYTLSMLLVAYVVEAPSEMLEEDSKFVPLNPDDSSFGPPNEECVNVHLQALLLIGFQVDEVVKIQKFLKELEGEFLEVVLCTEDMLTGSLWEAINTKQPNLEASKIAKALPRICFLSGLTGEEMMMFIDAFPESGLAGTVFAAVVPNSADKPLLEVIEEIMGDHEMMNRRSQLSLGLKYFSSKEKAFVFGCSNSFVVLRRNHDKQARDIKINWHLIVDHAPCN
ncbi:septation ring formation regulator EzrA [Tanacetum coccineum]